jgi:hypothetical protein
VICIVFFEPTIARTPSWIRLICGSRAIFLYAVLLKIEYTLCCGLRLSELYSFTMDKPGNREGLALPCLDKSDIFL